MVGDALTVISRFFQMFGPAKAKALFPNSLFGQIKGSLAELVERSCERDV